jgi:hypothetical protein
MEYDSAKRGTVSERPAGKADRARASTLLALGLAEEKEQALTEASLLSADVEDTEAITSGDYKVLILGTDLAAKKAGKAFTVRATLSSPFDLCVMFLASWSFCACY